MYESNNHYVIDCEDDNCKFICQVCGEIINIPEQEVGKSFCDKNGHCVKVKGVYP